MLGKASVGCAREEPFSYQRFPFAYRGIVGRKKERITGAEELLLKIIIMGFYGIADAGSSSGGGRGRISKLNSHDPLLFIHVVI